MKSLQTLLKVAQRRMDELGVEAVKLGQAIDDMRTQQTSILAKQEHEAQLAAKDMSLAQMLPAYRLRVKWQVDQIRVASSKAELDLVDVRERLSVAYQEKSKFEHLIEQEAIRQTAARAAKEQAMLDEVAINRAGGLGK